MQPNLGTEQPQECHRSAVSARSHKIFHDVHKEGELKPPPESQMSEPLVKSHETLHQVRDQRGQLGGLAEERTMTIVNLSHVPRCSAVGDKEVLKKRWKCLVVRSMDVDPAVIILFAAVMSLSRHRMEGRKRMMLNLLYCFHCHGLLGVVIESLLRVYDTDQACLGLIVY